LGHRL